MDNTEERQEVTTKELAAKYGVTESTVDSALRECVASLHSPYIIVEPGRYRLIIQDLVRLRSALSRD